LKKLLFIVGTPWASGYYRMTQAQTTLKKLGYFTDAVFFNTVDPRDLTATLFNTETKINLKDYDTFIFQMVWHRALNDVIRQLNGLGKFTVMELDDQYDHLPSTNPSFWSFHPRGMLVEDKEGNRAIRMQPQQFKLTHTAKGQTYVRNKKLEPKINPALDNMRQAMCLVKQIQVSTPELAEYYSKYNDNIVVLENSIENEYYDKVPKIKNEIPIVCWFGTRTHIEDLRIINGCLPDNCKLLIAGFPEVIEAGLFKYHQNIELIPPYKLEELPTILAKGDIGIVPLVECKFNDGKSDLKGLEFGAMSIPCIASDVAPYRRWIRHGENGYLVKGNKAKFWMRYLRELVDNKELREKMGVEAKKDAMERDINKYIKHWEEVYFN
jgi:glycosyltransferase involved in cell wall biosynthesis